MGDSACAMASLSSESRGATEHALPESPSSAGSEQEVGDWNFDGAEEEVEDLEETEEPPDLEDLEELRALGLALAGTVITRPEFNTITDSGNCLDDASLMPLRGRCTKADIVTLKFCLEFFWPDGRIYQTDGRLKNTNPNHS